MESKFARTAAAVGALMIGTTLLPVSPAMAQEPWSFSANIGAVSNYMWRGTSQTGDQPAIQGGLDAGHESGFYAGTWVSNVDFGDDGASYELDLYTGFGGAINDDFSYDISAIYYAYPDGRDSDFAELGASGTFKWFTLGLAYTVYGENDDGLFDDGDIYYYAGVDLPLPYDFGFSLRGGYYDFTNGDVEIGVDDAGFAITESADYWNYGASISRDAGDFGTFALNWDQNNGDQNVGFDPDPKFWVSWLKEF
ncbi:MAG: TorF family putative porin [Thiohalocapsa sp.]|nr:TorF family putative porin [Thiohalocapsa sp.]MCF7988818.1 TorF family putative porin [Thiohalocapsa sp.]